MPKDLFLIRHAQAEKLPFDQDFNRPLSAEGVLEATQMGDALKIHSLHPQLLITSPALRALRTAEIFGTSLQLASEKTVLKPYIYEASAQTLFKIITDLDDQYTSVALFGHNPGLSEIGYYFYPKLPRSLSTASVIRLRFEFTHWNMLTKDSAECIWEAHP